MPLAFGNCNSFRELGNFEGHETILYNIIYIYMDPKLNYKKRIEKDPTWKESRLPYKHYLKHWKIHGFPEQ